MGRNVFGMNEETMKILTMIEQGKITAAQGQQLLDAMNDAGAKTSAKPKQTASPDKKSRILRVVVDTRGKGEDNARVRINVPLQVAKKLAGLTALIPNDAKTEMMENGINIDAIDLEELIGMFQDGLIDENLVDVEAGDEGKGASVKIYVD